MLAWRLLVTDPFDGVANMALDAALHAVLERQLARGEPGAPSLRFSSWTPAAVSTGRHQRLADSCDLSACQARGVDVVKRPTGGRGVFHDDELTYAVVAPAVDRLGGPGVSRASAALAEGLVKGLRALGVEAECVRGTPSASRPERREACFASASRAEVVVAGRKLCGSAQLRGRAALLQHGSLPLSLDAAKHARVLGSDPAVLAASACGLRDCLPATVAPSQVRAALAEGLAAALAVVLEPAGLTDEEVEAWEELDGRWRQDPERWAPASTVQGVA